MSKDGYRSEMPKTKSKKMLYSSVGDEERRRANEVQADRDNLEYQRFGGQNLSATMGDAAEDGTLGATQPMDTAGSPRRGKSYQ